MFWWTMRGRSLSLPQWSYSEKFFPAVWALSPRAGWPHIDAHRDEPGADWRILVHYRFVGSVFARHERFSLSHRSGCIRADHILHAVSDSRRGPADPADCHRAFPRIGQPIFQLYPMAFQ